MPFVLKYGKRVSNALCLKVREVAEFIHPIRKARHLWGLKSRFRVLQTGIQSKYYAAPKILCST
jgi:hypothetical protein